MQHVNHAQFRRGISLSEAFERMERTLARRERARMIRLGRIVPAYGMKPQMMVKIGDTWIPEIKYV